MNALGNSVRRHLYITLFWLFESLAVCGAFIGSASRRYDPTGVSDGAAVACCAGVMGLLLLAFPLRHVSKPLQRAALLTCLAALFLSMLIPAT